MTIISNKRDTTLFFCRVSMYRMNTALTARVVKLERDEERGTRIAESRIKSRNSKIQNSDARQIAFHRDIIRNSFFLDPLPHREFQLVTLSSDLGFTIVSLFTLCFIFYTNI